ncbi:hypothetical protein ACFC4S_22055 [Priestia megaterium]|uniref:hypothetical protein n=1 Tax=Priestia megaterium TaxID=1404 RepID=UPI0035E2B055
MKKYVAGDQFKLTEDHKSELKGNFNYVFKKGTTISLFDEKFCYEDGISYCIAHKVTYQKKSIFRMHFIPYRVLEPVINYKVCAVAECRKEAKAGTYCHMHYRRDKRTGTMEDPKYVNKGKECSVEGCSESAGSKGMCYKHYQRDFKNGDPSVVLQVSSYDGISCRLKNCEDRARSGNLCDNHYHNYLYHSSKGRIKTIDEYVENLEGENTLSKKRLSAECLIDNCNKKPKSLDLCSTHYANFHYYKGRKNIKTVEEYLAIKG